MHRSARHRIGSLGAIIVLSCVAGFALADPLPKLVITEARYTGGGRSKDVIGRLTQPTGIIQYFYVTNATMGGDVASGEIKTMVVKWRFGESTGEASIKENHRGAVYPTGPDAVKMLREHFGDGLRVINAHYGDGVPGANVTKAVAAHVKDDALNLSVSPEAIGIADPNPGRKKELRILYLLGDEVHYKAYPDRGRVRINAASYAAGEMTFEPLPLDDPVTSFALTEDATQLVITHQASNKITVWDIAEAKVVATHETTAPRSVLCRGGKAYVVNWGEGTISVFARDDGWQLSNELKIKDRDHIQHISAARGKAFDHSLIATSHEGRQGSYRNSKIYRVEVKRDRATQISGASVATVAADGRVVLTQGSFNLSPSGGIGGYPYKSFITGRGERTFGGGIQQTPWVYQIKPGPLWIANNAVFGGVPVSLLHKDIGRAVVPDATADVVYGLTERSLTAYRWNAQLTEIGDREVVFDADTTKDTNRIFQTIYRHRGYMLDHPIAVTRADGLHVFITDNKLQRLLSAKTTPFLAPTSPKPGEPAIADKGPAPIPRGALAIPLRHVEGVAIDHKLDAGAADAQITLMTGPDGMSIAEGNRLVWKPGKADVGAHTLKFRVRAAGRTWFERPTVEIVASDVAARAGGNLDDLTTYEQLPLEPDHVVLAPGLNHASMLLLQGDQLTILGRDGWTVQKIVELPHRYRFIAEREDSYIAIGLNPKALDVIDKKTLKVRRRTPLDYPDITDLAIHPHDTLSYVCVRKGFNLPRYQIVIVDEDRGRHIAPSGLNGKWVKVTPDGATLFAAYADIYERGSKFHINPNWQLLEIPQYGNIDMLLAFDLDDGQPVFRQLVRNAGANGQGLFMSPDGRRVSYCSFVGFGNRSGNIGAYAASDLAGGAVVYSTKGVASCKTMAYHPTLPIIASPGGGSAVLFHRETGKRIEGKLVLPADGFEDGIDVRAIRFSPDGRSLIFHCGKKGDVPHLRRVELRLDADEAKKADRGFIPLKPAKIERDDPDERRS